MNWRVRIACVFTAVLLLILSMRAQQAKTPLTNADVVKMVSSGLPENLIISSLDANEVNFDVSADGILALKKAGVSDKIIDAMLSAEARKKKAADDVRSASAASVNPASTPATAAPFAQSAQIQAMMAAQMAQMPPEARAMLQAQMAGMGAMGMMGMPAMTPGMMSLTPAQAPHCFLLDQAQRKEANASLTQIAQSTSKGGGAGPSKGSLLRMFASQALTFAALSSSGGMMAMPALNIVHGFSPMMMGGMPGMGAMGGMGMGRPHPPTMTYVWALPGPKSANVLTSNSPRFELNYPDIVGIDPDEYEPALVHLVATKDNWRLVGATKSKGYGTASAVEATIDEERVPVKLVKKERGRFVLEPEKPLEAGEYGVVLRPVNKHNASGHNVGAQQAEAQIFYSVWDFSFNPDPKLTEAH